MNLTIEIPDELALEEYKSGRLTKPALRRMLGLSTRDQLDGFLKAHALVEDLPTIADLELERQDLRSIGF
jgi:hypothetical protein